ncbi:DUF1499 domain-containing protein [Rhodobaculum claviforme]|uniref:DUF1499 domain-containing protein n=1 Tax=Rhodobaculum claviforme TaxID=1549854 RepID=A0A934TIY6_9RHOB|nr:DUF1499 domain-containing protein [Rhodobaculum claviforme]MBK5926067.1 hypothetical protein [Rhodobaculum claviforme]
MIKLLAILALLGVAGVMLYIRFTPSDPADWHVDPRAVSRPDTPNSWLIRPVGGDAVAPEFMLGAQELAQVVDAVIRAQPRTRPLAGSVEEGQLTYVTRTPLMGYPDYVSVRVFPTGAGAGLAVFSRSRFGHSDLGTNRKRLEDWMREIEAAVREKEAGNG